MSVPVNKERTNYVSGGSNMINANFLIKIIIIIIKKLIPVFDFNTKGGSLSQLNGIDLYSWHY